MGATSIKCKWENGIQRFYDSATDETVHAMAPMWFKDDFVGASGALFGDVADIWDVVVVGDATSAVMADTATGKHRLHLHATNEAEDAVLHFGDQTIINILNDVQFETKLTMTTTPGTGCVAVFGMCGDHNLDKDTVAESAWFRLQASAVLLTESDDAVSEADDAATGQTLVAGTAYVFRIDFADLTDVKFFVDGVRVSAATTHDLSALTATTGLFQPYFSLDKATGTGLGDIDIDYVAMWGRRDSLV